jgi:hypothetical protein
MMGKSLTGRIILLGGGIILRRRIYFSMGIYGVRSLVLEFFGESEAGGTGLLGVFGTRARISLRYPGAREMDRFLLASREENSILGSV